MNEPCERKDIAWLEKMITALIEAHDKRYEERFTAQEAALKKAEENNMHWKQLSESWQQRMDERERQFLSKGMGYVVGVVAIVSMLVTLARTIMR